MQPPAAPAWTPYLPTSIRTCSGGRKELPTYLPTYLPTCLHSRAQPLQRGHGSERRPHCVRQQIDRLFHEALERRRRRRVRRVRASRVRREGASGAWWFSTPPYEMKVPGRVSGSYRLKLGASPLASGSRRTYLPTYLPTYPPRPAAAKPTYLPVRSRGVDFGGGPC